MTRSGLTERDAVTGALENVSKREREFDLRDIQPDGLDDILQKSEAKKTVPKQRYYQRVNQEPEQPPPQQAENRQEPRYEPQPLRTGRNRKRRKRYKAPGQPQTPDIKEQPKKSIIHVAVQENGSKSRDLRTEPPPTEKPSILKYRQSEQLENVHPYNGEEIPHSETPLATTDKTGKFQFSKDSKLAIAKGMGRKKKKRGKKPRGGEYQSQSAPENARPPTPLETKNAGTPKPDTAQSEIRDTAFETASSINQNAPPQSAPNITANTHTPGADGKLRFNKESKLQITPIRAAPRKSRKKKLPKAEHAARYEPHDIALVTKQPEQAAVPDDTIPEKPLTVMAELPERPLQADVSVEAVPERAHTLTVTEKSRLREKPAKLNVSDDNAGTGKTPKPEASDSAKKPKGDSKLRFSDKETPASDAARPDKALERLKDRADKYNTKLEKARDKLPSKVRASTERIFDEAQGKPKTKIQFEKEILPPGTKPAPPAPIAAATKGADGITRIGARKLHQKIFEVEEENVGTKAGHRAEQAAESLYRGGKRVTRSAFRYLRNKPYRTVEKLEKQAVQANVKYSYRRALNENPQLRSNVFSRFMQKRKIKQEYAKAAREAKRAGTAIKKTGDVTAKAAKAVASVIKRHPVTATVIVIILLLVFFSASLFASFGGMAGAGLPAVLSSSYLAENVEIDASELSYTEWETDLLFEINNIKTDYPGYDEYRYQTGDIGHNPYELMAFLTAVYQDFKYEDIEAVLRQIFDEQYGLSVVESVETRYTEGEDGEMIPYDWNVLTVSLTQRSFTDVITPRMNTEQAGIYALLMQTKGNRQYTDSPFDFNWLPNVTSYYGYRVHPITGAKDYHKGIDIAVPVGTDIHAGHDGTVTFAGNSAGYGNVVVVEDDNGVVTKYAHCDSLLVSEGQRVNRGDIIAKSGNTGDSTGPHLHMEVLKDGNYLNPLYFCATNDTGVSSPVYGYAGAPMGDGSYAALIEEAERHLGKSYVFGANGPDTFDCSSFVCWTLNQSGAASIGRTSAQGLYNLSNPVPPDEAQPGDLVFFHSTYSTANTVTHVGIYVGGGRIIHAGSPVQYASINTSYWQSHFYAFGRIN
jgi:murein DD-endopeptidase MepM/ murein hydrolase activator NlpD